MDERKRKRSDGVDDPEMVAPNAKKAKTDVPAVEVKKATSDPSVQSKLEALKRSIAEKKAKLQQEMDAEEKKKRDEATKKLQEIKAKQVADATAAATTRTPVSAFGVNIKTEATIGAGAVPPEYDLMSIPKMQSTLKANIRFQQEQDKKVVPAKKSASEKPPRPAKLTGTGALFDTRMGVGAIVRKKRALNFVEPGTYIKQAEELRAAQEVAFARNAARSAHTIDAMEVVETKPKKKEEIPAVEWWDVPYLATPGDYGDITEKLVSLTIDHPILIEPPADPGDPGPRPLMLTARERKRLRKQNRADKQKLEQDLILLGEKEAPKPRVRIANMMRVLGAQAVQDPTQIEKKVREEMAEREARHNERNLARKLTPEQRSEKKKKKFMEDQSLETKVAVFRVTDYSDPRHKFKVEKNAQQYHLTGVAVTGPRFTVVVVEGGPKALKQYKKLMLRRIKWYDKLPPKKEGEKDAKDGPAEEKMKVEEEKTVKSETDEEVPANVDMSKYCRLAWEGEILKAVFRGFRSEKFDTEIQAKKYMADFGTVHYWDMSERLGDASVL